MELHDATESCIGAGRNAAHEQVGEWRPESDKLVVMGSLAILSFMVALDACVIVTSLDAIVEDLQTTANGGFWIGTAYLLANAVAMPFIADLSKVFGRQSCLMASLLFFTVGTILCCLSHAITQMLVGRALQGIGGAGIIMLCLVIYTDLVPLLYRPKWYGIVLGAWALGNCAGPIVGGAIAQYTTWRWIFYIMFPFCAAGIVLVQWKVKLKPRIAAARDNLASIDWAGGIFFISSSTLFLVAVSGGGLQSAWDSAGTLVPLCVGTAGLLWTFVYEARLSRRPFLDLGLFWGFSPIAIYVCGAVQGLVIYGQLYYIPQFFIVVKGFSPVDTGLALFPVMFTLVPGSIVTGALVTRTKNYQYPIWAGWSLTVIASGLTLLWDINTPIGVWAVTLVLLGLGHGAVLNAQNFASQAACKPGAESAAAAMYAFARQFGMAVGVGVGGSVFQNIFGLQLDSYGLPADGTARGQSNTAEILGAVTDDETRVRILHACVRGLHGVYGLYVGLSGAALLMSLPIRKFNMDRALVTEQRLQSSGDRSGDIAHTT
ncbi:MFS-type transporter [Colletotrichum limetticola]|uniref:MFS-type transporter n=1 Tax=Colletotrichum limetticola TaxID=1209924 RepID=A0ABQ9PNW1_9PEZI|nr:MFS-type transporter [Colletotrichum limetticola]